MPHRVSACDQLRGLTQCRSATVKAGSAVVNAQSQTVVFVGVPSPSLFRSALSAASSPSIAASGSRRTLFAISLLTPMTFLQEMYLHPVPSFPTPVLLSSALWTASSSAPIQHLVTFFANLEFPAFLLARQPALLLPPETSLSTALGHRKFFVPVELPIPPSSPLLPPSLSRLPTNQAHSRL
jgi:hypothetical protein